MISIIVSKFAYALFQRMIVDTLCNRCHINYGFSCAIAIYNTDSKKRNNNNEKVIVTCSRAIQFSFVFIEDKELVSKYITFT